MKGFSKNKKLFLFLIIGLTLWLFGFARPIQAQETHIYLANASLRDAIVGFFDNFFGFHIQTGADEQSYKQKYFDLLRELIAAKMTQTMEKTINSLSQLKRTYPDSQTVSFLGQDDFGHLYVSRPSGSVRLGATVVDSNWFLVGRVIQVEPSYVEIQTLNFPDLKFSLNNFSGQNLGLAQTTGLGYVNVNYVEPSLKVKPGDLVITSAKDDIFSPNFLIGQVIQVKPTTYFQKLIVEPFSKFDESELIIVQ